MNLKQVLLLPLTLWYCTSLTAQTDTLPPDFVIKGKAIGISAPELVDQMMAVMPGFGHNAKDMTTEQSVKSYIMPPRLASGRAASTTYALTTCLEYYTNFESNYKLNLSPDFVKLNLMRQGGVNIKNALRYLVTEGTVSADVVPFEAANLPLGAAKATRYLIENYLQLFSERQRSSQKVFQVQKALLKGNPVMVELAIPEDFAQIRDTRYYTSIGVPTAEVHTFLIVSYNIQLEAFEIQSSWGREWGYNGYLWVDFDDFALMARNGYVVVPTHP